MIKVALYHLNTQSIEFGDESLLSQYSASSDHRLWVDFDQHDAEHERELLSSCFNINELAIADAQRRRHPPKFEVFDDHLFLLLRGLSSDSNSLDFQTIQIACFIGKNILITRHAEFSPSINRAWKDLEAGKLKFESGLSHLVYQIARNVVDRYTPILLTLEDRLEAVEEEMFNHPSDQVLAELVGYSGKLKKLRRTLVYQKNLFATILELKNPLLDSDHRHEFNDVYEHFERLSSLANLFQELVTDLINGYLGLSAHHLNKIMKVLTIATVVFLPLSLLAGIYGMNFEYMPELKWHYAYFSVLGMMGGMVISVLLILKKLRWL